MKNKKMPLFGVGPFYVIVICAISFFGIIFTRFKGVNLSYEFLNIPLIFLGIISIILGVFIWIKAVFSSEIQKNIKLGKLVTKGVYAYVRNPIYSAFFLFTLGVILLERNLYLFCIPLFNWLFLTILMKYTEEKWLYEKFGDEYKEYCKKVNRCIPWFK